MSANGEPRKFIDLPLGARFRYTEIGEIFVVIDRFGCGKVAQADIAGPTQGIYTAAVSTRELKLLTVIPVPFQTQGANLPAISDDDLWHIACLVSSLAKGNLFNFSQHDCVTAIRAGFVDPDTARAMLNESQAMPTMQARELTILPSLAARGYVVGATVRQDFAGGQSMEGIITSVASNGALGVDVNGTAYGWSANFCTPVSPPQEPQ